MMNNPIEQTQEYQEALASFLCKEYDLEKAVLTPTNRGFFGETWKLVSDKKSYFVKLVYWKEYQDTYKSSFEVIDFLCKQGIDFISTIKKTRDGCLFAHFNGAILGMFDWLDGRNIETNETKPFEYELLAKVYAVPVDKINMRKEDFSGQSADMFLEQWAAAKDEGVKAVLENYRPMLEYRVNRLHYFSTLCQKDLTGFYLTHGDAGGNFFVCANKNFLIDWDDALLAPPERDAWVMGYCDWARELFEKTLHKNGIEYNLRLERLAYYSYYMFFFWLAWLVRSSDKEAVESLFKEFGEERIEYADKLMKNRFSATI